MRLSSRLLYGVVFSVVAGAMLIAPVAMHFVVEKPKLLLMIPVAAVAVLVIWRGSSWVLPLFVGLVWTSIGQSFFGGLSPIETGGLALLAVAGWNAKDHPVTAWRAVLVMALLALPLLASGLVSPLGEALPLKSLRDIAFVAIVALGIRDARDARHTSSVLAFVGIFLGLGAVGSVLAGPSSLFPLTTDVSAARAAGPFGEPNFFALAMAALAPFAIELYERGGREDRLLGALSLLSIVAGILATGSRGGLLALGVAVVGAAVTSNRAGARSLAVGVVLASLVLVPTVFAAQAADSGSRTISGRAGENLIAGAMFLDHPLFGVGPNNYPVLFRDYARRIGNDARILREPHSLPLQIASEQGVAGILGWLGVAAVLIGACQGRALLRDPVGRATILAIGTYLLGSLFLHGSQLRLLYMLFGLLLALAGQAVGARRAAIPG